MSETTRNVRTLTTDELDAWHEGTLREVEGVKLCPPPRHMRHGMRYVTRTSVSVEEPTQPAVTEEVIFSD